MIETLLLWLFAATALVAAVAMLVLRHPMRVALALTATMLSLAGVYAMLGVHVIAVFQVLIYVGAVMVFMVYAIMLLDVRDRSFTLRFSRLVAAGQRQVQIAGIDFDPPGPDVQGEHVVIQNDTSPWARLQGWTLNDAAGHVFTFPAFTLVPGFTVRVWTRAGAADDANLFWGRGQAVWNNTGDTATLRDGSGALVDTFTYPGHR